MLPEGSSNGFSSSLTVEIESNCNHFLRTTFSSTRIDSPFVLIGSLDNPGGEIGEQDFSRLFEE